MSRDFAYVDRNTVRGEKAVKNRSTRVKFCQRPGGFGIVLTLRSNPHPSRKKRGEDGATAEKSGASAPV
jgi:hypothetical protein